MKLLRFAPVDAVFSAIAPAQSATDIEERFARLDADGNQQITWEEAQSVRENEFTEMDADGDGMVTENEFGTRAMPFTEFDANNDGKLTQAEYVAKHQEMFKRFDSDNNDVLNKQEFAEAQATVRGN